MKNEGPINVISKAAGISIALAVIMIILGCLAVAMPGITGLAVSAVFGWLRFGAGVVYMGYAFTAVGAGSFVWRILIGLVYMAGGIYLAFNSDVTLQALTFALAAVFVMEGIFRIASYFQFSEAPGSGW